MRKIKINHTHKMNAHAKHYKSKSKREKSKREKIKANIKGTYQKCFGE